MEDFKFIDLSGISFAMFFDISFEFFVFLNS
jgi:hypothetical protein